MTAAVVRKNADPSTTVFRWFRLVLTPASAAGLGGLVYLDLARGIGL